MTQLSFGKGNAKLDTRIATFSLPSGYTCPAATSCLSRANRQTGRIQDGPACQFRCFSASQESQFKQTRAQRWSNLDKLKGLSVSAMADLIGLSLPDLTYIRIHVSGDFYSQSYFDAWIEVAKRNPAKVFYAYTKSLHFWVARLGSIPANLRLVASVGGRYDSLISAHNLKFAKVVYSENEAAALGLPIDHDDSHAILPEHGSFALLIHGSQPAKSEASRALSALRKAGVGGYNRKDRKASAIPTVPVAA